MLWANGHSLRWIGWKVVLPATAGTFLLTALLYAPVLIANHGPGALTNNQFVTSLSWPSFWAEFLPHAAQTASEFVRDIPNAVVVASIGLAALGTAGLLGSSRARAGLLVPALLAGGAAVLTARHAIPFPRTWIYLLPFVALVVDAGAVAAVRWIRVPASAAGIVLATGLALLALRRESVLAYADTGRFVEAPIVVDALSREMSPGDSIVADVPADAPVQFYMLQHGVPRAAMRGRAGQAARTFYIVKPADYSLGSLTSAHPRLLLAVGDAQLYVSDDTSRRRLP